MQITIRQATKNDAALLAELGAKTFYDTFRPYNTEEDMQLYIGKAYSLPVMEKNFEHERIIYLIAENEQQEAIGYVKLIQDEAHEKLTGKTIELEKIYVLKDRIGTGAGA